MMHDWFLLSLVLALLSLDISAVGQFMVARPIVVGPVIGMLTGHFELGLGMGALIELIWIGDVPVGAHLPLDLCVLSGVAVAFASELTTAKYPPEAAMTYAIGVAIPLAALSTQVEILLRKFHVRWVHFAQRMALNNHLKTFEWINLVVILELFLKGFLMAVLGLTLAHFSAGLFQMFPAKVIEGLYYAHWLLLALGCSAVIDLVVEKKNFLFLVLSVASILCLALIGQVQGIWLVTLVLMAGLIITLFFLGKGENA
jgi:PTS system mannose-specific IIC component/fructoselysine and glucoselysine-specific PTS system IIC component